MKLIVDMNLSPVWADLLSKAGLEALHWSSIGANNAPDLEIMAFARDHGYAVFTNDQDFGRFLVFNRWKAPSVVQIRAADVLPHVSGEKIIAALVEFSTEIEDGALVTIDSQRTRVRVLPFGPK